MNIFEHIWLAVFGCMIACYDENPDWAKFLGAGIAIMHIIKLIILVVYGS